MSPGHAVSPGYESTGLALLDDTIETEGDLQKVTAVAFAMVAPD